MINDTTLRDINREEKVYREWQREQKNKILAMSNPVKKQARWNEVFPPFEHSDDWMLEAKVF